MYLELCDRRYGDDVPYRMIQSRPELLLERSTSKEMGLITGYKRLLWQRPREKKRIAALYRSFVKAGRLDDSPEEDLELLRRTVTRYDEGYGYVADYDEADEYLTRRVNDDDLASHTPPTAK